MSYVKVLFQSNAIGRMTYVLNEDKGIVVSSNGLIEDEDRDRAEFYTSQFLREQTINKSVTKNQIIQVIQSYSPKDSKKLNPEMVNSMGVELIESKWKDHQYVVVTHSDRDHLHNHIMINPVSYITGERVENKKVHYHDLSQENNRISKKNNLWYDDNYYERLKKSPFKEVESKIQMMRQASFSYYLKDKIDFAKAYTTSFKDFKIVLGQFDIDVKEHGNKIFVKSEKMERSIDIVMLYNETNDFIKELREVFENNKEMFKRSNSDFVLHKEIEEAKSKNIQDILSSVGEPIINNSKGQTVLEKNQKILIKGNKYKNLENKMTGNIIQLLTPQKGNYLETISMINGKIYGVATSVKSLGEKYPLLSELATAKIFHEASKKLPSLMPYYIAYKTFNAGAKYLDYVSTAKKIYKSYNQTNKLENKNLIRRSMSIEKSSKNIKLTSLVGGGEYLYQQATASTNYFKKLVIAPSKPILDIGSGKKINVFFDLMEFSHMTKGAELLKKGERYIVLGDVNLNFLNSITNSSNSSLNIYMNTTNKAFYGARIENLVLLPNFKILDFDREIKSLEITKNNTLSL